MLPRRFDVYFLHNIQFWYFWLEPEQNKIGSPTDGMILTKFEMIYYLKSFICIACCLMISLAFWQISLFTEFPQIDLDQKGYQKTLQNTEVLHPLFLRGSGQAEREHHPHPGAHQTLWCDSGTTPQLKASDRFPRFSFHLRHLTLIPVLLGQTVPRKFCSNQWFLSGSLLSILSGLQSHRTLASVWPQFGLTKVTLAGNAWGPPGHRSHADVIIRCSRP